MMQQMYQPVQQYTTRALEGRLGARQERIFRSIVDELSGDEVWQTFESMASVKNRYTVEHCYRVAEKMYRATLEMGLCEEDTKEYVKGALFHDLGKAFAGVREAVDHDGNVGREQFEQIKQHPLLGGICASLGENSDIVVSMAAAHHKYGMSRSCLTDREMYVVQLLELFDSYDAMTRRNYNSVSTGARKKPKSPDEAVMELYGMAKRGFYMLDVFYIFYKSVEGELEQRIAA